MEKIINIHLHGQVLNLEESAYQLFIDYQNQLKQFLAKDANGFEVYQDIEIRMVEILLGQLTDSKRILNSLDIQEVIAIIGHPQMLAAEQDELNNHEDISTVSESKQTYHDLPIRTKDNKKSIRRNQSDKVVNGFCGGLANYFGLDSTIIRLIMVLVFFAHPPLAMLIYVLSYIIPSAPLTPNNNRKLFRDSVDKIFGGVCGGLARFFNVESWIIRLIFLAIVLISMFSNVWIFESLALPALIIYISLWVLASKASSGADYMKLKGNAINISNYSEVNSAIPQSNRNSLLRGFFRMLGFLIMGFALLIFIPVAIAMVVGSFLGYQVINLVLTSTLLKALYIVGMVCLFVLPIVALITWLVRKIMGYKSNRKLSLTFVLFFVFGIMASLFVTGSLVKDLKTKNSITNTMPLQTNSDTLFVNGESFASTQPIDNTNFEINKLSDIYIKDGEQAKFRLVKLKTVPTTDSDFSYTVEKIGFGSSSNLAANNIGQINYQPILKSGNVLHLSDYYALPSGQPYRGQFVIVTIHVPQGKKVIFDKVSSNMKNYYVGIRGGESVSDDLDAHTTEKVEKALEKVERAKERLREKQEQLLEEEQLLKEELDEILTDTI